MIAIDSSALLAVAFDEPQRANCEAVLQSIEPKVISAGTLLEALITSEGKGIGSQVRRLIDAAEPQVIAVDDTMARLAFEAFRAYGKGRHPARLNYGDCFSCALAKHLDCPLLFIGDDFAQTDIRSVLSPS